MENVELSFEDDAIPKIASIAYEPNQITENIGARRLATVMEELMERISSAADERRGEKINIGRIYVKKCRRAKYCRDRQLPVGDRQSQSKVA